MKFRTIALTACVLTFSTSVFSQISLFQKPFEISYEIGFTQQMRRGAQYNNLNPIGICTGLTGSLFFTNKLSMQLGVIYSNLHYADEQDYEYGTYRLVQSNYSHNISVPIYAAYTVPLFEKVKFTVFAGPDIHYGLAEKRLVALSDGFASDSSAIANFQKEKGTFLNEGATDLYKNEELQRLSISFDIGGGFEFSRFLLKGGYGFGLTNINKIDNGNRLKQSGWNISLGYKF